MLVLSREVGQCLVIGSGPDRITVKVVAIRNNKIRLGVEAPRAVTVDRAEISEAKEHHSATGAEVAL